MTGLEIFTFLVLGGMIVTVIGFFLVKDIFRNYEDELDTCQEENDSLINAVTRLNGIVDIYQMITKVSFEDVNNEINNVENDKINDEDEGIE